MPACPAGQLLRRAASSDVSRWALSAKSLAVITNAASDGTFPEVVPTASLSSFTANASASSCGSDGAGMPFVSGAEYFICCFRCVIGSLQENDRIGCGSKMGYSDRLVALSIRELFAIVAKRYRGVICTQPEKATPILPASSASRFSPVPGF